MPIICEVLKSNHGRLMCLFVDVTTSMLIQYTNREWSTWSTYIFDMAWVVNETTINITEYLMIQGGWGEFPNPQVAGSIPAGGTIHFNSLAATIGLRILFCCTLPAALNDFSLLSYFS